MLALGSPFENIQLIRRAAHNALRKLPSGDYDLLKPFISSSLLHKSLKNLLAASLLPPDMILLALLFLPAIFGQQCQPGQDTAPCGVGGVCQPGEVCITDTPDGVFVCCPLGSVFTTTTTSTVPPTTASSSSSSTSTSCVDKLNPQTGTSDCPNVAYLCTNPAYKQLMQDQCPKTCGYCGTGSNTGGSVCQDKLNPQTGMSDCPNVKYLCSDTTYKALMKDQCPKTCGYC